MPAPTLLWFRQDLRLADNPALQAAIARGAPILPVFLWAPGEEDAWAPGAASRWWLHESLQQLEQALRERGARLVIRRTTDSLATLREHTADYVERMVRAIPLRRAGTAADVADVVTFLLSDKARYVTGATIPVAGGLQLA